jgi:MYXO-CTERM domain-containing protein
VVDATDNCPSNSNVAQGDRDGDGLGDVCDQDADGDAILDGYGLSGGGCSCDTSSGGAGGEGALWLIVLAVGLVWRRRGLLGRSLGKAALAWALVLAAVMGPTSAEAQTTEPRGYSVERFSLTIDRAGLIGVEWARRAAAPGVGRVAVARLRQRPAGLYRQSDDTRGGSLVADRLGGALGGAISLFEWLELGVELPFVLAHGRDDTLAAVVGTLTELDTAGLGDLRMVPQAPLLRQADQGIDLAVMAS